MSRACEPPKTDECPAQPDPSIARWYRAVVPVLTFLLALLVSVSAAGDSPPASTAAPHQIPAIEVHLEIDGLLDEPAWADAWTTELKYEVEPGENIPAPVRTEVLVFYSRTHLYVGFRAHDPDPTAIRAHLAGRDQAWPDDWVGVALDTFNDERRNYFLAVNPLGVQMDNIEARTNAETVWDGIWDAAARITDSGWSAELGIPFSTLRFQSTDGPQIWGFDAVRGYPRNVFHKTATFPRDRSDNCYLCQALKIEGFDGDLLRAQPGGRTNPDRGPHRSSGSAARRSVDHRGIGGRARTHRPLGIHTQPDVERHLQSRFFSGRG